jgi:phage gpG-like protein
MSSSSSDWLNRLNSLSKQTYTSKYQDKIDSLMDSISKRKEFSYDFNTDPLYQQYKDQYTKLGKEASMNAAANASSLTGGYGNSYAVTAGEPAVSDPVK